MPTTISLSLAVLVLLPVVALVCGAWLTLVFRLRTADAAKNAAELAHQATQDTLRTALERLDDATVSLCASAVDVESGGEKVSALEEDRALLLGRCDQLAQAAIEANEARMRVQAIIGSVVQQKDEIYRRYQRMLTETSNAQHVMFSEIDLLCRAAGRKPSAAVAAVVKAVDAIKADPPLPGQSASEAREAIARVESEHAARSASSPAVVASPSSKA